MSINKEHAIAKLDALEKEAAELRAIIDKPDVVGVVKPSEDNRGWAVGLIGLPIELDEHRALDEYYAFGNWYETEQAAELAAKRARLTVKLKEKIAEFNDGWVPDWSSTEFKCCLGWDVINGCAVFLQRMNTTYFESSLCFKPGKHNNFGFTKSELRLIITGEEL